MTTKIQIAVEPKPAVQQAAPAPAPAKADDAEAIRHHRAKVACIV